ncbi:hypothetical protein AeMF1_008634, partial [Aphanomyces euteiches]
MLMPPVLPAVEVPELKVNAPLDRDAAEARVITPLDALVPAPVVKRMSPPTPAEPRPPVNATLPPILPAPAMRDDLPPVIDVAVVRPAVIVTSPPAPVFAEPTVRVMSPPFPPDAGDDCMEMAPVLPALEVPELNVRSPLDVESADAIVTEPLAAADPAPLANIKLPPTPAEPRPPYNSTLPPGEVPVPPVSVTVPPEEVDAVVVPAVMATLPPAPVSAEPTA